MAEQARVIWAGLGILDRQLLDRDGRYCGKVDDVEIERDEATGTLVVTGLRSGPGALLYRFGRHRIARWLQRVTGFVFPPERVNEDPTFIPIARVMEIGDHVSVAVDADELGSAAGERWVRDHVISRIPGHDHDAP
jgi:sporulation protein YlmC with PRC-barrel domain